MKLPMKINIIRLPHCYKLPQYATKGSAGLDLYAAIPDLILLDPNEKQLIPTGIAIAVPEGYEGQIRPRSSMALEGASVTVINDGTIDSDYTDEIKFYLVNTGKKTFEILPGAFLAQIVITKYTRITWEECASHPAKPHGLFKESWMGSAQKDILTAPAQGMPRNAGLSSNMTEKKYPRDLDEELDEMCLPCVVFHGHEEQGELILADDMNRGLRLTDNVNSELSLTAAAYDSDEKLLKKLRISAASLKTSAFDSISEAKNILQELLIENKLPLPKYSTEFWGPTNNRTFQSAATVQYSYAGHNMVKTGEPELTKKDAEKSAAFSVLRELKSGKPLAPKGAPKVLRSQSEL